MELNGKVVVVTGGASGLGRCAAEFLVREKGARVAVLDRPASDGQGVTEALGAPRASFHPVDVSATRLA